MGYFHGVTRSAQNTALAYDYFVGHTRWFAGEGGAALLKRVRDRVRNGGDPPTGEDRRVALVPQWL
jgi:hypothetical protein